MQLREYMTSDCDQLAKLFFQTIHSVNAKDYTKEQLDAWATSSITAKPFFEKRGYRVKKEQTVVRNGISLTNFIMEK